MSLPQEAQSQPIHPPQTVVPDDVLAQIGGIESQFAAMRDLVRKQAIMQIELQRRQVQIDEQNLSSVAAQAALAKERTELTARLEALAADRAALAAMEQEIEQRAAQVGEDHEALDLALAECERLKKELAGREAALAAAAADQEEQLTAIRGSLNAERASAQRSRTEFEEQSARLDELRHSLAEQAQEVAANREAMALARDGFDADAASHQSHCEQDRKALEALGEQTSQERRALTELESALVAKEEELAKRQAAVAAEASAVETTRLECERVQSRLDEFNAQLDGRSSELEQARAALELGTREQQARIESEYQAQQAQVLERSAAVSKAESALAAERAALIVQAKAIKDRTDALSQREDTLASANEDLHGQLAALEERRHRLEAVKKQNDAAGAELSQRRDVLDALAARLEAQAQAMQSSAGDGAGAEAGSVAGPLLLEVIEEYEELWRIERMHGVDLARQCASLAAACDAQRESLGTSQQDLAELERVIEGLKDRLRQTANRVRELEDRPQVATGTSEHAAPAPDVEKRLARRRARLGVYKTLLRRQAVKIRKASEVLTKRFEQVEQVMAMRADLAAARQRLIQAERREIKRAAISRTVAPMAGILAIISLTGALSWAIAREIAPARFSATAMLKAEARDRVLNSGELAEWQTLHENLISDPRLHEALAERYKRQGMASLAAPGDVLDLTKGGLTFESGTDGELKLRLEGQGAEPTARTLEIFTNGLTNFVNSGNIRRVDGATTAIAQASAAGDSPIDSIRTQYTLGLAGGGSVLCSALAFSVWRRLSQAKSSFEQDTQLESLIERVPTIEREQPQ